MAQTFTTNLNLAKADIGDAGPTWGNNIRSNMDILDAAHDAIGTSGEIIGSTVAGLPAAGTAGRFRRLTDGDAAGAIVIDDGSDWRCIDELEKGLINIACPPYNADHTAADNATEVQAAFDRMKSLITGEIRATVVVPGQIYRLLSTVTYDTSPANSSLGALVGLGALGASGFDVGPSFSGSWLLDWGNASTDQNNFLIENISFTGRTGETYDGLVRCQRCVQGVFRNIFLFRIHTDTIGLQVGAASGNLLIDSVQATDESGANCPTAGSAIISATGGWTRAKVKNLWFEASCASGSALTAILVGGFNYEFVVDTVQLGGSMGYAVRNQGGLGVSDGDQLISLTNINAQGITISGIDWFPQNLSDGTITINNCFFKEESGATATYGVRVHNKEHAIIRAVTVDGGFDEGIRVSGNRAIVANNVVLNADDAFTCNDCTESIFHDNIAEDASTIGYQMTGTSGGGNVFHDNLFAGSLPTTTYSGFGASDGVVLGRAKQVLTGSDTADASPRILTDRPHYEQILINNSDTSGGTQYRPSTTGAVSGQRIYVLGNSTTSSQPIKVSVDGGTNCATVHDGTTGSFARLMYMGVAWAFEPGTTIAGC